MANSAMPTRSPAQQLNDRFTTIYAKHSERITALVRREVRVADRDIAEDLAADAFFRAWLDLHKCNATTDAQMFAWLAVVARRTVGQHYRIKKNTMERPVDTGHWSFANRDLAPAGGCYTPSRNGFRTATGDDGPAIPKLPIPGPRGPVDHDGDSDPDVDELLRRVREHRALVGAR
ncbi:RNA polymerase sigma factor [Streptomyces sp. NPDC088197]|uniref:RNA polymerase sigma factor n=1 Tax=Streptomyces sp. NPDC088197 TaxID=3365840 RepID=UPI0037F165AF